MGPTMCLFWEMSPERLPNDGRGGGGTRVSVMEFMNRRRRWWWMKLEQQQPGLKQMIGKLQRLRTQRQMEKTRQPTLEEWFLASPGLNNGCCSSGSTGAEAHGLKQSSSRFFPSLFTEPEGEGLVSRGSGEGLCLGVEKEEEGKGQRGTGKKKVRFRLPGLAQIIVFDSADEMAVKKVNSTQPHNWGK